MNVLRSPSTEDIYPKPKPAMRGRYLIRNQRAALVMRILDFCLELLPLQRPVIPPNPKKILICQPAHLGDVLMTLPAVAWLKQNFPAAQFGFLGGSWGRPFLEDIVGYFEEVHLIDHFMLARNGGRLWTRLRRHAAMAAVAEREMRAVQYDLVLDFYPFFERLQISMFRAGIPVRVGWTSGGLSAFYTHRVDRVEADRHVIDYLRDILNVLPLKAPVEMGQLRPLYPPRGPACGLPSELLDGTPYTVLHTGAGLREKEWPETNWIALANSLARQRRRLVLLGSGQVETARNARIANAVPGVIDLTGRVNWSQFVNVIEGCQSMVGLDSVCGHLAAAFQRPMVTISTGMINPKQWGPWNQRGIQVTFPTPCAPCNRKGGCTEMFCVRSVQVASVLSSLAAVEEKDFSTEIP